MTEQRRLKLKELIEASKCKTNTIKVIEYDFFSMVLIVHDGLEHCHLYIIGNTGNMAWVIINVKESEFLISSHVAKGVA